MAVDALICKREMNPVAALEWELGSRAASALLAENDSALSLTSTLKQRHGFSDRSSAVPEEIRSLMRTYLNKGVTYLEEDGTYGFYYIYGIEDEDHLCGEELWGKNNPPGWWKLPLSRVLDEFEIKGEYEWGGAA